MSKDTRYIGLDLHAETITVAVAETSGEIRALGKIPNRPESIARMVKKLGPRQNLRVCYEAGPCGYVVYWQLTRMGVHCDVVAPTLVPVKPGDRVKTDKRDAEKLARAYRNGELTPVWVPDAFHEGLRDLLRAREAAKTDQLRARHRLGKFLLRHGWRRPDAMKPWTQKHLAWIKREAHFELVVREETLLHYLAEVDHARDRVLRLERTIDAAIEQVPASMRALIAGLQALRGVAMLSSATIAAEVGEMSRFPHPRQLMGYNGGVPREHSSGGRTRRGAITKAGNAHLRRIVGEAAWAYRFRPAVGSELHKRQEGLSSAVKDIAWKAQHRLHRRYRHLISRGKTKQQTVTAIGRELLGFIWHIGVQVQREQAEGAARTTAA